MGSGAIEDRNWAVVVILQWKTCNRFSENDPRLPIDFFSLYHANAGQIAKVDAVVLLSETYKRKKVLIYVIFCSIMHIY